MKKTLPLFFLAMLVVAVIRLSSDKDETSAIPPVAEKEQSTKESQKQVSPLQIHEGATQKSIRNSSESGTKELAQLVAEIPRRDIPPRLHAQSAIEIQTVSGFEHSLSTGDRFRFPLEGAREVEAVVSKITIGDDDSQVIFGKLADTAKSHLKLVFRGAQLTSGSINLMETAEQYRISISEAGQQIVSKAAPNIDLAACACTDCKH